MTQAKTQTEYEKILARLDALPRIGARVKYEPQPQSAERSKEYPCYASKAKIHLVYSWFISHCLNLKDEHKTGIVRILERVNENFRKAYEAAKQEAVIKELPEPTLYQHNIAEQLDDMENVSLVRSFPSGKYGNLILHYEINRAFEWDLAGIPGFYFNRGLFRFNLPQWSDGLIKPYYIDGRIAGLFLYQSLRDGMPKLFSSHNLFMGKRFIEPIETEGIFIE